MALASNFVQLVGGPVGRGSRVAGRGSWEQPGNLKGPAAGSKLHCLDFAKLRSVFVSRCCWLFGVKLMDQLAIQVGSLPSQPFHVEPVEFGGSWFGLALS